MLDRYFKVLIQEMNLKVDQGYLSALLELFAANEPLPREEEVSRPWIFAGSHAVCRLPAAVPVVAQQVKGAAWLSG